MGIGKNIKRYRHMAQLTQDQLALELGVARATIAQWEAETSTPKAERIFEIARTLGVPADQILEPARISYLIDEPGWTPALRLRWANYSSLRGAPPPRARGAL